MLNAFNLTVSVSGRVVVESLNVWFSYFARMSLELKEKILELLERDREFRYAVAGLIGLDEILKRLDEHDRKFNEILAVLKEHTARLDGHDRKFNEILAVLKEHTARLDQHDRKFNEILAVLKEHTARLDEHDRKFNEILAEIRSIRLELVEVRSYLERFSLTLEGEAREVVAGRLRSRGLDVKLTGLVFPELEIDIYGVVGDLCVVGEASTRVGVGLIRCVDEKIAELGRRYPGCLRGRVVKVVYTMWATEDAVREAEERGIWLVKATEELTPLKI